MLSFSAHAAGWDSGSLNYNLTLDELFLIAAPTTRVLFFLLSSLGRPPNAWPVPNVAGHFCYSICLLKILSEALTHHFLPIKKEKESIATTDKIMAEAARVHNEKHNIKDEMQRRVDEGQSLVADFADPSEEPMDIVDPD